MKKMKWVSTIFALLLIFIAPRFNNYLDGKLDDYNVLEYKVVEAKITDKFVSTTKNVDKVKKKRSFNKTKTYYSKVSYGDLERTLPVSKSDYVKDIGSTCSVFLLTVEHKGQVCQILSDGYSLGVNDIPVLHDAYKN
mgnify:FL=1